MSPLGIALLPLSNELGEGRIEDQILKEVQAYESKRVESNNYLFAFCGDMNNSPLVVMNVPGNEVKESEPITFHVLVVVEEQGIPHSVSLDWVVERMKNFCHVMVLRIKCWCCFLHRSKRT